MYFNEKINIKKNLYAQIKKSAEKSFEEYYYSFFSFSVFLLGAFIFYIDTKISRGIFVFLDLFILYKIVKAIFEIRKVVRNEELIIEKKISFYNDIYKFSIIFLVEAFIRHFLVLNITIWTYIKLVFIVYGIVFFIYKIFFYQMKKYYRKKIKENNYAKIIKWKSFKHKIFVIISFLIFMFITIATMLKILIGIKLLVVLTLVYSILLVIALEIKCDLKIEKEFLVDDEAFDFLLN
ncbi:MAG: hypothetical protein ACRC57_07045 [Sarcina sp.]